MCCLNFPRALPKDRIAVEFILSCLGRVQRSIDHISSARFFLARHRLQIELLFEVHAQGQLQTHEYLVQHSLRIKRDPIGCGHVSLLYTRVYGQSISLIHEGLY